MFRVSLGPPLALLHAARLRPSVRWRFPRKHLSTGMATHVHLCCDPQFAWSDDLNDDVAARLESSPLQPPTAHLKNVKVRDRCIDKAK
jgi:hypothetical protein